MESEVPKEALNWLARKIGKWEPLARRLGFDSGEEYGFRKDNSGDNFEQARSMLFEWKRMKGRNATLQVLCEALRNRNVGRADLADEMQQGDWK